MPHLIIDYSANLDAALDLRALTDGLHAAALETGVFPVGGCRTRLARRETFAVGDGHPGNAYIHVQVRIGAGRPPEVRQKAAEHIFERLKALTAERFARAPLALSFEIVEMDPVGSLKHNNLHEIIEQRRKGTP